MDTTQNVLNWITAIGTLSSALIALFVVLYTELKAGFNKAEFEIQNMLINPRVGWGSLTERLPEERDSVVQVIFSVEQVRGNPSSNVEVILKSIWKYDKEGRKEKWPHSVPMNLTWGEYKNKVARQRFSKGVSRYCNLGTYRMDEEDNYSFRFSSEDEFGDPYTNWISEELHPGMYELEVVVVGENAKTATKLISLNIFGGWREGSKDSFEKCFKVEFLC